VTADRKSDKREKMKMYIETDRYMRGKNKKERARCDDDVIVHPVDMIL